MRKVIGASKQKIIKQFFIESFVYVTTAFIGSLILFFVTRSYFFNLLQLKIDDTFVYNLHVLFIFFGIFLFAIIFSAGYPAYIFSAYKPISILYSKSKNNSGIIIRKLLAVFQFSIAIGVIICSIIISRQLFFIQHTNTGIERTNIVMIPFTTTLHNNYYSFKEDIKHLSGVNIVATARYPLYQKFQVLTATEKETGKEISLSSFTVDDQFITLLNLHWKLTPQDVSVFSKNDIVINEATINKLNLTANPIGQEVEINGEEYHIKGVLKNFNYTSLTSEIDALCILVKADSVNSWGIKKDGCLFVKFYPNTNIPQLISSIQNIYNKYDQNTPFNFSFMDDSYETMYKAENRLADIIYTFTAITISIALLGLFGLASFSAEQRIKEIGIRKVLGASIKTLVYLLIKDFIKPVLFAIIIGTPLAWYFMHKWLENFAYHTPISIWVFVFSIVITVILTISTVASLSIKAASINPVKNLRTE